MILLIFGFTPTSVAPEQKICYMQEHFQLELPLYKNITTRWLENQIKILNLISVRYCTSMDYWQKFLRFQIRLWNISLKCLKLLFEEFKIPSHWKFKLQKHWLWKVSLHQMHHHFVLFLNMRYAMFVTWFYNSLYLCMGDCVYWHFCISVTFKWVKVFKKRPIKNCGRQPLKKFILSILEYFIPNDTEVYLKLQYILANK